MPHARIIRHAPQPQAYSASSGAIMIHPFILSGDAASFFRETDRMCTLAVKDCVFAGDTVYINGVPVFLDLDIQPAAGQHHIPDGEAEGSHGRQLHLGFVHLQTQDPDQQLPAAPAGRNTFRRLSLRSAPGNCACPFHEAADSHNFPGCRRASTCPGRGRNRNSASQIHICRICRSRYRSHRRERPHRGIH